jgi:hypothetical protein
LPSEYILRKRDWGINDLESHDVDSPAAPVLARLNADAAQQAGISPDDLISFERTRAVRFRRCGWLNDGTLHVGALQGSARPLRLQDPDVLAILRGLNRWLTHGATRVELPLEVRYRSPDPKPRSGSCLVASVTRGTPDTIGHPAARHARLCR